MKTPHQLANSITILAFALIPSVGVSQSVRNFDNNNNQFQQASGGTSVLGNTFNFLGGNDRLVLLRNDDLAGLGSGAANMGDGRDVVITSFNMSGTFNLGNGNDLFISEGDVNFNGNATDILVLAGTGDDIIAVTTDFCAYGGEQGNDVFVSDGSRNIFDGGEGNDTYSAEAAESGASIDLAQEAAFVRFSTPERLINIENVRGSDFSDEIFGDEKPNRLDGLGGDDAIDGDAGNDTIFGGGGTNTLFGNIGVDTLVVRGTITSKTRLSPTTIRVTGSMGGIAFNHTATGFEQVFENKVLKSIAFFMGESTNNTVQQTVINESSFLTTLSGLVAGRTLNGNGNANTINGDIGNDDIAGFGGNDTLNGNAGDDFILGGDGVDSLNGGDGQDFLSGGAQNDTLAGGPGNDSLDGGAGNDRLTGGAGNDSFVFVSSLAGSADIITDYKIVEDTVRISRNLVGNLPPGILANIRFKNTAQGPIDADDRIIYESSNGRLSFDSNGSAVGGRVLIATLPTGLAMVASEIIIQ
jgi:Ca2+-binding RTX toxin-like protein